jgi:hypothetical protein
LVQELDRQWGLQDLRLFASDRLDFNLDNEAPAGSVKERAFVLVNALNSSVPPRDLELLEKLRLYGNNALRDLAAEYLAPQFFSPTGLPEHAILLGRAAFLDRRDLRHALSEFKNPTPYSTRVLVVTGDQPCGKTYSWEFIRHLAKSAGCTPQRLQLKDRHYTPKVMLEYSFRLLGFENLSGMPELADEPQLARVDPIINWFKGTRLPNLTERYWLVIDDLNDESVTQPVREAAYALAYCAEEAKADLWVVLLGYNNLITDSELGYIGEDHPQLPDVNAIAEYFVQITQNSAAPLTSEQGLDLAGRLATMHPSAAGESREALKTRMNALKKAIEQQGQKLQAGVRP